jgi:hypothetical protein
MKLEWMKVDGYEEALLGDFEAGDGVRFSLVHRPSCYRRGPWRLLIEVAAGPKHLLWGCFDGQDQPERWYHRRENALSEAQELANVLSADREAAHESVER